MAKLFDMSIVGNDLRSAVDFISNILQASTEYSIIGKDMEGKILLWNEGARRTYGYEPEEIIGKANSSILHTPEDIKAGEPEEMMKIALEQGKWEGKLTRVKKNGDRFSAYAVMTPLLDQQKNQIGFLLISKNITEEQRLLEQLEESQLYTRSLIEVNIDALMTTDMLGIITDVNAQMEKLTGHPREELIGTPFKNYCTDPKQAEEGIRQVLTEGKVINYELIIISKDNRQTLVSYNASIFRDAAGKLKGVFAAARDITEQKKLEQQLRNAQLYNRSLIEASVDGLITVDLKGIIFDLNEQMCRMSGYTREELIGTIFADYFLEPERATAGINETLEKNIVINYILTLVRKDKKQLIISFNASVFQGTNTKIQGVIATARDVTKQLEMQKKLSEERTYNRGLIEASVDGLITVDSLLAITDVNESMCRMSGYTRKELIDSNFSQYFKDPKQAIEGVRLTLDQGSVKNYQLVLLTKTKKEISVSFNAAVFKNIEGKVQGIFASARDITEQAKLQNELTEQQAYTRSLIEASADALFAISSQGLITDVNEETTRLMGYSRKYLLDSNFSDYFTEPERAKKGIQETFNKGRVIDYELTLVTHKDKHIIVSFNAAVFSDSHGNPKGILASARNIELQKKIEQQLRNMQLYTRSIIESTIDAMVTTDPLGIISDVNQQMIELTGYNREKLIGSYFSQYFTDPKLAEEGIRLVLKEEHVNDYELIAKAKNGKEIPVSFNASTFYDQAGKLHGILAIARDITERKLAEKKLNAVLANLERSNKDLEQFAYIASHDLQEPLRMVQSYVELLARRYKDKLDKDANEFIEFAVAGVNRMQRLINDLLDYSRVITRAKPFTKVDCNIILQNALFNFQKKIKETDANITSDTLPIITADETQVSQIFQNLISNALKFCKQKPEIHIRAKEEPEQWIFSVQDNGIGINPEYHKQLFVLFRRLHTEKEYSGTGIGLAICKKIVERHGGKIWVESEGENKGSVFYFTIPKMGAKS